MEGETGVTRSLIDDIHAWDIERDQIEGGSCVARSIIAELHSSDME